ncbi:MAG: sugar ABC transporter ATP-binding protein [Propionibacteriaceae bacterium]|jgi:ribose transport system ATP-binding protein|nr:sugar ABC transporter ATP-binding protein [Propionibacteriaceae bacterium]
MATWAGREDPSAPTELLRLTGVSKSFGPVSVLRGIDLTVHRGEVMVLLGENGAGKSTLIKLIAGIHRLDSGSIQFDGVPVQFHSVAQGEAAGIATIHQELNNVPQLSVAENILLGRLPSRAGFVTPGAIRRRARQALARVGLSDLDVDQPVGRLGVAHQQLIEIAHALDVEAKLLILDEPTAALTAEEISALFAIMVDLRSRGVGMIFISHHLDEVARVGDRVAVLRDGDLIDVVPADTDQARLVRMMVGRDIADQYPRHRQTDGESEVLLDVEHLCQGKRLLDICLRARAGEVVGLAGLVGAGRTELLRAIFGADHYDTGVVQVCGRRLASGRLRQGIREGLGLVPEDRKSQGLVAQASVRENIGYATLASTAHAGFVDRAGQAGRAEAVARRLRVRMRDVDQPVADLSGGNQQKVVFARWALAGSQVLLLDEPTRGVDVGARVEIYEFINDITAAGATVVMASSDLPEVLGMSDRIVVMNSGRIVGEIPADQATSDQVMALAVRDVESPEASGGANPPEVSGETDRAQAPNHGDPIKDGGNR